MKKIYFLLLAVLCTHNAIATTYYSVASATNFNALTSWSTVSTGIGGSNPTSISNADDYIIQNASALILTGSANVRSLTIKSGSLTVSANTLTISIAAQNNTEFNIANGGTLNLSGTGTIQVNGAVYFANGSACNQSGGLLVLYPNSGTAATSVGGTSGANVTFGIGYAAGSTSSSISTTANAAKFQFTGGILQIVDPVPSTSASAYSLAYRASTGVHLAFGTGHTVKYGDGISTKAAGSTNGMYNYYWVSLGYLSVGNMVVDIKNGTNRFLNFTSPIGVLGNLTITSGNMRTGASTFYVAGNIVNNDTLTSNGPLYLGTWTNGTASSSANAQTIGGTGVYRNSTTNASATAKLLGMTVNNSNATGVTLNVPLSISGTLTMTSGLINTTSTNLLTLGTAMADATLSGTPSATNMIVGPFARTFAASRTSVGTYSTTTLFPVGKGSTYLPLWIDPTTTSGGAVIMSGEAFNSNSGSAGAGVSGLSANSWSAIPTTGSGNLTASRIQLSDASVLTTSKLLQASTSSGSYTGVTGGGSSSSGAAGNVTSSIDITPYYGYFAYGDLATCSAPSNQPTNFVTSLKTSTSFNVTFDSASTPATGYLVVRDTTGNTVAPTNGTLYTVGVNASLTGTVIGNYYTYPFTFSQTGLTASTNYEYFIYAFNNSGCSGPTYITTSPLSQLVTTCGATINAPTAVSAANVTTTSMNINFTASTTAGVTDHEIDVATNSGFTSFVSGYQAASTGASGSSGAQVYSLSGLSPATTYYVRIRASDGAGCYSANTTTLTQATPCNPVTSFNEDFETTTGSNFNSCWAKVGATGSTNPQASTGISGSRNLYIYNGAVVSMPPVSNASASTHRFKMKVRANFTAGEAINFGYLTNPNDATTFVTLSSITPNSTTVPQDFELSPVTCPAGITTLALRNGSVLLNSNLIDNIVYEPIPAPTITSVTSSTACGGSTKVVITGTDMNNITTATIGGVSLLPFDTVSATRLVKNAMTTVFSGTTSITNSIGTGTNGSTLTFTNAPVLSVDSNNFKICTGSSAIVNVTSNLADYTSYTWSPSTGVSGGSTATFNPTSTTTYTLNASNSGTGCVNSLTRTVTVDIMPSALTLSQGKLAGHCYSSIDSLMVSGGTISSSYSFSEVFSSSSLPSTWTFANGVSTTLWTVNSGNSAGGAANELKLDANNAGISDNSTWTATLPVINASNFTSNFQLTFKTILSVYSATSYPSVIKVQTSTNNTTWTDAWTYTPSGSTSYGPTTVTVPLTSVQGSPSVYIRYYFNGKPFGIYYWSIDDVSITATINSPVVRNWSPTTGLYTNRTVTNAYISGDSAKVYSNPTTTTKYYVTASNGTCTRIDSIVDSVKTASSSAALATSSVSGATSQCADPSGWTYYENPSNSNQLIFGINKGSSGMSGETITLTVNGSPYTIAAASNGPNKEHQSFLMGRGWDVSVTTQPTTPVQVRFFYDPADTTDVNTARDAAYSALVGTNSSTLAVKTPFEWFKTVGVPYDASWRSAIVGNKFPSTHMKLTPTYGVLNGVNYVEFTVSSFSGGSGGAGFGAPSGSGGGVGLPVTWAGFDVKTTENGNELTWKTASEKNTDYFNVEYSYDGATFFNTNKRIDAAGTSFDLRTYSYLHADFAPYVYYRIKQVDRDGKVDYSVIKLAKRTAYSSFKVSVYPVPMQNDNLVHLDIVNLDKSPLSIRLTDITGKLIRSTSMTPSSEKIQETYDMSPLTNGVYFIEVKNGQGKETIKISK